MSNVAVSEKIGALRTARFFAERAARADVPRAIGLLQTLGAGQPPVAGDELDAAGTEDDLVLANSRTRDRKR